MFQQCLSCGFGFRTKRAGNPYLCCSCVITLRRHTRSEIRRLGWSSDGRRRRGVLWTLYDYRDLVRELVIRAKVRSEPRALEGLLHFAGKREEVRLLAQWADIIVAAPSSLWGRLRGRFDVAGCFAAELARCHRKRLRRAPRKLFWQLRKRALLKDKTWYSDRFRARRLGEHRQFLSKICFGDSWLSKHPGARVLVVDDVVTTGHTLRRLASELPGVELRFLAIAAAGSHDSPPSESQHNQGR